MGNVSVHWHPRVATQVLFRMPYFRSDQLDPSYEAVEASVDIGCKTAWGRVDDGV
jgi:hypothetical protein